MVGVVFETATPFEMPLRMTELIRWWHHEREHGRWHSLLPIGVFVDVFLAIHPFQDGTGRAQTASAPRKRPVDMVRPDFCVTRGMVSKRWSMHGPSFAAERGIWGR